jgi:hypothetical protein
MHCARDRSTLRWRPDISGVNSAPQLLTRQSPNRTDTMARPNHYQQPDEFDVVSWTEDFRFDFG